MSENEVRGILTRNVPCVRERGVKEELEVEQGWREGWRARRYEWQITEGELNETPIMITEKCDVPLTIIRGAGREGEERAGARGREKGGDGKNEGERRKRSADGER